jgi:hypothetical protein
VTLTATAAGWATGTITVNLTPSGFVLVSGQGIGQDFGMSLQLGGTATLTVQAMQLDTNGVPQAAEALAGGMTANLSVTSGSTGVGTITGNPVVISGGSTSGPVTFQPVGTGTSALTLNLLSVSPSPGTGFSTPSIGTTLNANVD